MSVLENVNTIFSTFFHSQVRSPYRTHGRTDKGTDGRIGENSNAAYRDSHINKKFELMLTRRAKAYSSSGS